MSFSLRFLVCLLPGLVYSPAPGLAQSSPSAETGELSPATAWHTNYAKATALAREEHKLLLLDFTGSDWCGWCQRLHAEILTKTAFLDYARDNLVLVELDFPHKKPQPEELKRQNELLSGKFSVDGYPTIIMVDADGRELGRTGYMEGGAKTFVRELKRFAAKAEAEVKLTR
jgi:protein disulfide-isomerase